MILTISLSNYTNFIIFRCASNTQCQGVTFDGSQCHIFYTKLPDGQSPSESNSNWYGECEEDRLAPATITTTTTTAEISTPELTTITGATTVMEVTTMTSMTSTGPATLNTIGTEMFSALVHYIPWPSCSNNHHCLEFEYS